MKPRLQTLAFALGLGAAGLAGCTVGPDFHRPDAAAPRHWTAAGRDADPARSRIAAGALDPQWWNAFHDDVLTSLIRRVTVSNLDVRTATARLLQARAARRIAGADTLPALDGTASYLHARSSQRGLVDISGLNGQADYNVWQPGFDASWEIDLWGRVRRQTESADAAVDASEDARRDMLVSVLAETARDYVQLRGVQAQQAILRDNLDIAQHSQRLTQVRFADGVATQLDVAEATAQVKAIEAQAPLLDHQLTRLVNALGYLLDAPPRALDDELRRAAPIPAVPPEVPVGLPSELAERRPDIRRAEARLHAATADIGVARGSFYPRITLSANLALQATHVGDLGSWDARMFGIGPALSVPIFEGGRLKGMLALRSAQQQEALLDFRRTVLSAWHEIDNAMDDYAARQSNSVRLGEVVDQDRIALEQARRRYVTGAADFLNVLTAQQALLKTRQAHVDSTTEVSLALIGLFKALGGGWERTFPAAATPPPHGGDARSRQSAAPARIARADMR
ncbi:efflux transporter outer membrane subunit [Burkholderia alba]|uniref:efflux transporter outer membrane subunit n=1 Tax=Burkholderia alba TaxID=2683677 RepID=UPI002B060406|nr:efflux transporter outer membrane subunit [Burkholderia alba]